MLQLSYPIIFVQLLESSDDGADADSEEDNEPAKSNSTGYWGQDDNEEGEKPPADAVRCKIKKKKKKKKNKVVKADTTDASEEHVSEGGGDDGWW